MRIINSIIRAGYRIIFGATPEVIDHAPIKHVDNQQSVDYHKRALERAKRRHGRDFKAHIDKPRDTDQSRDLKELERLSIENAERERLINQEEQK